MLLFIGKTREFSIYKSIFFEKIEILIFNICYNTQTNKTTVITNFNNVRISSNFNDYSWCYW